MRFYVCSLIMFVGFCCAYTQPTSDISRKRYLLIQKRKGNHVVDDVKRSPKEGIILIISFSYEKSGRYLL